MQLIPHQELGVGSSIDVKVAGIGRQVPTLHKDCQVYLPYLYGGHQGNVVLYVEGADLISMSQNIYLPSDILRGLEIVTKIFMMQNEIQPAVEPLLTGQPFPRGGQDQWVELSWEGWATYLTVRFI